MALEANFCRVQLDQPGPGGIEHLLCVRRTRLGKTGQQICVGDRVQINGIDWPEARGAVAALEPRSSLLERPAVANCSRVVVAVALEQPQLDPLQLTRFLLTAERTGVAVELVLTKADLLSAADQEAWRERLRGWGYEPLLVSAQQGEGIAALRERLTQPGQGFGAHDHALARAAVGERAAQQDDDHLSSDGCGDDDRGIRGGPGHLEHAKRDGNRRHRVAGVGDEIGGEETREISITQQLQPGTKGVFVGALGGPAHSPISVFTMEPRMIGSQSSLQAVARRPKRFLRR